MSVASDFAHTLRDRRRALGLSRTRLAERSGLASNDIARWERGVDLPAPEALIVLADAVGLDDDETRRLIDASVTIDLTGPDISVEIVDTDDPAPNPFPERTRLVRTTEPRFTDRLREILDRVVGRPAPTPASERLRPVALVRPSPPERTGLATSPTRRPPAPGIVPDVKVRGHDPARRVYTDLPSATTPGDERAFYLARRVATGVGLAALAIVLWWSVGELNEGLTDLFDLFRSTSETPTL